MNPEIIATMLTNNRNTQRLLKYLVLADMTSKGLTKEQAERQLEKLLNA